MDLFVASEIAVWITLAFLTGIGVGWVLRGRRSTSPARRRSRR